ncbi:MAG: hypothetical protein LBS60_02995 [Deltaproteobacteria bacterium]|jgi:hypothetical protein|nr:hypothetical protein [Deltaproteobacteria bacterium]
MTHNLAPATPAPVATAAGDPAEPLPIAEVSVRPLLEKILGVWGEALASGDFTQFHRLLSAGWRANDDPKTLALAYQSLYPYRELMETFPRRGKLVVIESRPLNAPANSQKALRDTLGPESPWLVRVEWRSGRAALGFNINFVWEDRQWRPVGLTAQAYRLDLRSGR